MPVALLAKLSGITTWLIRLIVLGSLDYAVPVEAGSRAGSKYRCSA